MPNAQARRYSNENSNPLTTKFYRNRGNGNDFYTHKLAADFLGDNIVFPSIPGCKQYISTMGLRGSNSYARCCLIVKRLTGGFVGGFVGSLVLSVQNGVIFSCVTHIHGASLSH